MMYCDKTQNYVNQNEHCMTCIFYKREDDACDYKNWIPGLIQKEEYNEDLEGFPNEHI